MSLTKNDFLEVIEELLDIAKKVEEIGGLYVPLKDLTVIVVESKEEFTELVRRERLEAHAYVRNNFFPKIKPLKTDFQIDVGFKEDAYGEYYQFAQTIALYSLAFEGETRGTIKSVLAHELFHSAQYEFAMIRDYAAISKVNAMDKDYFISQKDDVENMLNTFFYVQRKWLLEGHAMYVEIELGHTLGDLGEILENMHRRIVDDNYSTPQYYASGYYLVKRFIESHGKEGLLELYCGNPWDIIDKF